MGHATGQQLADKLVSSLQENNISLKQLQALESDGPNVNKTVWNKVNEVVLALPERSKGLVDIATCNLHVFHNAFSKALSHFGNSVSEFVVNIHLFFKLSPARKEDYKSVQEELGIPTHAFLKHVDSRWLTLKPALERIIEQWPGLIQYFLTDLPAMQKSISSNTLYKKIVEKLKEHQFLPLIHFLISVASFFSKYLLIFQKDEPLIHILHTECVSLL